MLILPMIAFAQDSINKGDKVQQRITADELRERLNAGIEKGTITQEQADKRYEAFSKNRESPDDKPDIETRYIRLGVETDELNRIKTKFILFIHVRKCYVQESQFLQKCAILNLLRSTECMPGIKS